MSDDDQHIANSIRNGSIAFKLMAYPVYGLFWLLNRIIKPKDRP